MLSRKLSRMWQTVRCGVRASRPGPVAWIRSIVRTARICRLGRFLPIEAFRLGLLNPDLPNIPSESFISRKNLTKLQKMLNPEPLAAGLRNKVTFYRRCETAGLPSPPVYAVMFPGTVGWASDGSRLGGEADWLSYLSERIPGEFFVKPVAESHGNGVELFTRDAAAFRDHRGKRFSPRELHGWLVRGAGEQGMILQQRVRMHPSLAELGRTEYVQTARVNTLLDSPTECRVIHAHVRLIVGDRVCDNSEFAGLVDNLQIMLDPATGRGVAGVTYRRSVPGFRPLTAHPVTGQRVADLQVPDWPRVCDLACRAAFVFYPMRAIGWDVAVTPDGPVLLEGNVAWDPLNQHPSVGQVVAQLAAAAGVKLAMPYSRPLL
ncbi:MAG: sugar-transfer associated ATP-grasp domain-containing protein [Phycisphaerae bacterium]|nr:sugar-transfer associated ATP-grasp domain-containing protein [Phycisphaerae bacterium]